MSDLAILFTGEQRLPRVVGLNGNGPHLYLTGANGTVETISWWLLYRTDDQGTTHKFRRLDRKNWELSVTAGGDRALLAHIGRRPLHRLLHPLRRLESLKIVAGIAVLAVTVAQHAPPEWTAKLIPDAAQARLVDGPIAQRAPARCAHEGGEAAVRKLLVRLDPDIGRTVEIDAFNEPPILMTSLPARKLSILRGALQELDENALAALFAHELSHIRHGDPIVATVRHGGFLKTWAQVMEGGGDTVDMAFSGLEERRADVEAMQMMRRAGIPLRPAAEMFEHMRIAKAQGSHFADDQRDFHFGLDARAQRWAAAAATDPPSLPAVLTRDEADALFNFCWQGRIMPVRGSNVINLKPTKPAGEGALPPVPASTGSRDVKQP